MAWYKVNFFFFCFGLYNIIVLHHKKIILLQNSNSRLFVFEKAFCEYADEKTWAPPHAVKNGLTIHKSEIKATIRIKKKEIIWDCM